MSKASVIYGFSVSPTHISGVRVSSNTFTVESQAQKQLPPATISHDAKRLLDVPTLLPILREIMLQLGNPNFNDPVYLTVASPFMSSRVFTLDEKMHALREEIKAQVGHHGLSKGESPVVQNTLLWQHGEKVSVAFAVLGDQLIKDYREAFYEVGLKIQEMEILPFSVLRGMAASGVLDALLRQIGADAVWGCFGLAGSQTWCSLWKGTSLLHLDTFTTPSSQVQWEEKLLNTLNAAGVEKAAFWFAWKEAGMQCPIDPLKLRLKAPVRPAFLGPIYRKAGLHPSMPALGAALKPEIDFPMEWDFLDDPILDEHEKDYVAVPYVNYQPVLPKLFFRLALLLLFAVILSSAYLAMQNKQSAHALNTKEQAIETSLNTVSLSNVIYPQFFKWMKTRTLSGIQLNYLKIMANGQVTVTGKALERRVIDRFLGMLSTPEASSHTHLKEVSQSVIPLEEKPPAFYFEFSGQIDKSHPKGGH